MQDMIEVGDKTFVVDRYETSGSRVIVVHALQSRGTATVLRLERTSSGKIKMQSRGGNFSFTDEQFDFIMSFRQEI